LWDRIANYFARYPSQAKVARLLLRYGLRIDRRHVYCGEIQISDSALARAAGVDRRVVRSTSETIRRDPQLRKLFTQLLPTSHLKAAASAMGWSALEVVPTDPHQPGILAGIAQQIAAHEISIRQAIVEDPMLSEEPKLFIITESAVPAELIPELRRSRGVKALTLY